MDKNIEYDECGNIKKTVTDCKRFHQDPYWTPNNFDLYFDYNNIPVNIPLESNHDLIRRLKIHVLHMTGYPSTKKTLIDISPTHYVVMVQPMDSV